MFIRIFLISDEFVIWICVVENDKFEICLSVLIPSVAIITFGFAVYTCMLKRKIKKLKMRLSDIALQSKAERKRNTVKPVQMNVKSKRDRTQTDNIIPKVSIYKHYIISLYNYFTHKFYRKVSYRTLQLIFRGSAKKYCYLLTNQ